jgi:hypothetical protein
MVRTGKIAMVRGSVAEQKPAATGHAHAAAAAATH